MKTKILVILAVLVIAGCSGGEKVKPNYKVGDMIVSRVESKVGQINSVKCNQTQCGYWINFWTDEGFDTDHMYEYEFTRQ